MIDANVVFFCLVAECVEWQAWKAARLVARCETFAGQQIVATNLQVHFKGGRSRKCKKNKTMLQFDKPGVGRTNGRLTNK